MTAALDKTTVRLLAVTVYDHIVSVTVDTQNITITRSDKKTTVPAAQSDGR